MTYTYLTYERLREREGFIIRIGLCNYGACEVLTAAECKLETQILWCTFQSKSTGLRVGGADGIIPSPRAGDHIPGLQ